MNRVYITFSSLQSINEPHLPDEVLAQGGEVGDAAAELLQPHIGDAGVCDVHRAERGADGMQHLQYTRMHKQE